MISRPDAPAHIRFFAELNQSPVRWCLFEGLQPYTETIAGMERYAEAVSQGIEPEAVWLLEHPPLFTAGTSANPTDLVDKGQLPVFQTGRGGQYTYHGPGQRVAYVILDLKRRRQDVRAFVCALEAWIINTLAEFNVKGERRSDRVGVWVTRPDKMPFANGSMAEDKIAAIGIRLRKWVSFHGISINVDPDLRQYAGIVPCGIQNYGVTSLVDLGLPVAMEDLDIALKRAFVSVFGDLEQETDLRKL